LPRSNASCTGQRRNLSLSSLQGVKANLQGVKANLQGLLYVSWARRLASNAGLVRRWAGCSRMAPGQAPGPEPALRNTICYIMAE
jgi:hypothetical protein